MDRQLVTSLLPSHPTHDIQHAETHVHVAIPGLDPLTVIIPSRTTNVINMMLVLQHYSYHVPATSQRDGITDSDACFPARIHQSGSSWSA